jgi:hypothetical protein
MTTFGKEVLGLSPVLYSDKAGGLLPVVYICKGAKVMLTANMCVPYGLFNGSMGRVEEIIYNTGAISFCYDSTLRHD